jgi:hypothetical protein
MSDTVLLEQLIKGQDALTSAVNQLVAIESGRVEREKTQEIKNQEFIDFIKLNREPLNRVRRWQSHIDKTVGGIVSKIPLLIAAVILSAAAYFGIDWLS